MKVKAHVGSYVRANILIGCKFSTLGYCGSFTDCGSVLERGRWV